MASKFKRMKACKLSFNRVSSLYENVLGRIKAAFMIINDQEWVSTPGQRSRYGVLQT